MSTIVRDTDGLSTTEYLLILLGIVVAGVFAWSTFSESLHQRSEDAALAIRDMQGRTSHATDILSGTNQQVRAPSPRGQSNRDVQPPAPSSSSSSFLTRIHTLEQQNQTGNRTLVPNAIFKTNAASSTAPTYIADSSGQRVDTSSKHEVEPLFGSHYNDAAAFHATSSLDTTLSESLQHRGANPFAPIATPNGTSLQDINLSPTHTGTSDLIQHTQQNPLGTGNGLQRINDFDDSTIADNPFRPALENLPENGETPLESFQIRRKASALYVFSGLWDTIDALVHPGRTFHQLQELTQTLIYLPDYCYHHREVCQANMLAGLFITMDSLHRFETGQLHLSDKQVGMLEGAAVELIIPGPEDTILDLAKLPSKVDNALDSVNSPNSNGKGQTTSSPAGLANPSPNAPQVCIRRVSNNSPDCFAAGTLVQTKDGKVPIEDIQVGDSVLALHHQTGQLGYFPVSHTLQNSNQPVRLIRVQGSGGIEERIVVTGEHPFFSNHQPISLDAENPMNAGTWMPAHDLQEGMWLVGPNGQPIKILGVEELAENADVHNLTVDDAHTYFVGDENPVLTHNDRKKPAPPNPDTRYPYALYRGSQIPPEVVFEQGFLPAGTHNDLKTHTQGVLNPDTGYKIHTPGNFVSTSARESFAQNLAHHRSTHGGKYKEETNGWLYYIYPDSVNDIDVNRAIPDHKWHGEFEIAVPGGIPPERIIGVRPVSAEGKVGDFIWNPNRVGPIVPHTNSPTLETPRPTNDIPSSALDSNGNVCTDDQCFAAGTLVHTETGPKPIEEIQTGDYVLARHEDTFEMGYFKVIDAFSRTAPSVLRLIVRSERGEDEIIVTEEHPFFTSRGWTSAAQLKIGEDIITSGQHRAFVVSREKQVEAITVYNLSVQDAHTYFVGENQMWVHNTCRICATLGNAIQNLVPPRPIKIQLQGLEEPLVLPGWRKPPPPDLVEISTFVNRMKEQNIEVRFDAGDDIQGSAQSQFLYNSDDGPVILFREELPSRIELLRNEAKATQYLAIGPERYERIGPESRASHAYRILYQNREQIPAEDFLRETENMIGVGDVGANPRTVGHPNDFPRLIAEDLGQPVHPDFQGRPVTLFAPHEVPQTLFRVDSRSQNIIFDDGFEPAGVHEDLNIFIRENRPSNFVSTTSAPDTVMGKLPLRPHLYVIRPRATPEWIDVNYEMGEHMFDYELEYAARGTISPEDIAGVFVYNNHDWEPMLGQFIPNPNFVGDLDELEFSPEFLRETGGLSSTPQTQPTSQ